MTTSEWTASGKSPVHLLLIVAVTIYVGETVIMLVLAQLPEHSVVARALLDSSLLIAVCFPALYYCMFRPMVRHVAAQRKAEATIAAGRLQLFKATMRTVQDIVNNGLMNLQLVRLHATDAVPPDTLALFDGVVENLSREVRNLGDVEVLIETPMAIGVGIDTRPAGINRADCQSSQAETCAPPVTSYAG